ncbi:MAG: SusC/RagA family TonB-linked outer membrane protein [Bacteroidota bacterium]|nr:SusC/RagA family TonB-linked outer membrane protein [Bacteroidota bacterium]
MKRRKSFFLCLRRLALLYALLIGIGATAFAQKLTVKGSVKDDSGIALPGVSILVKGTTKGTVSDVNGAFTIDADSKGVLVFSFVGLRTQQVPVNGRKTIDVLMRADNTNVDEVVVTALGIKREKKALGYSVSSIKSEELVKSGNPVNPLESLYGKATGVRVASTAGGPAGGMIINIRNSVSLTEGSNTRPLFVVDGIPIHDENSGSNRNDRDGRDRGTGINDINADDIESLEILKGAKAAVLYGYAGANGVVLITTKSGKKKTGLGIDYSTSYTFDRAAYLPKLQNEFGTGSNVAFAGLDPSLTDAAGFKYQMINGVKTPVYFKGDFSFGPKMDGRQVMWWDGQMRAYSPQSNNMDDLYQTGHLRTNTFSFSNGGDQGSYRASYTNKKFESIVLDAYQDNHVFSFNGNLKVSKKLTLTYASNYYYTYNHNAPFRMQDGFVTYGIPRDMNTAMMKSHTVDPSTGTYWYFRDPSIKNQVAPFLMSGVSQEYFWNQSQNVYDETRNHFIQSAKLNYEINNWLSLMVQSGFDYTNKLDEVKVKVLKPLAEDYQQGIYSVHQTNYMNFYNQALLNFDKKINDDFRVSGNAGAIYQANTIKFVGTETRNFLIENWFTTGNSSNAVKSEGSATNQKDLTYSVLGSAQVAYKDYLFLELQGRNDWSSILPPKNNSYFYPGASLSWIASQSLTLPDYIKYAKTRLSWADVGRPGPVYFGNLGFDVNSYGSIPYENASSTLPPADFATGIALGKLPPENLKPERKREFEAGLEMNFFENSRFGFEFNVYKNNTYNQIIALPVPASSGVSAITLNAGDVQNTGMELQLKGKPIVTHDFVWDATLNLAQFKTKINKLGQGLSVKPLWGVTGAQYVAQVGHEYGEIIISPWQRDSNGNFIVSQSSGIYLFDKDANHQKTVGHLLPDVTGGLGTNFTYKGFSLGVDFDFQFGGTMISQTNMYLKGNGTGAASLKYRDEARGGLPYYVNTNGEKIKLDSHTTAVPADSKYSFIFHDGVILPGVTPDGATNTKLISAQEYYNNTYWNGDMSVTEDAVYKSDYISLRRLTLAYQLPRTILNRTFIRDARVTLFGNNVAYVYKAVPNVIPESSAGTNEFTEYSGLPGVRSFGFELRFSF